jgi:uncharacterized protein YidB (DUF937 family)
MGAVMAALLPVVLAMLQSRGGGAPQANARASSGGGLGDILGQVLGGGTSSGGGLADLLARFQAAGFGEQASSWVGTGRTCRSRPTRSSRSSAAAASPRSRAAPA